MSGSSPLTSVANGRPPPDSEELYRAHAERLTRYVFRLMGDLDTTEDVVQEAFLRLLERPPADTRNVRAWLFTTATNIIRDRARKISRTSKLTEVHASQLTPRPVVVDPLRAAEQAGLRMRLLSALSELSERERAAVLMREEGITHREIAEALDTTTGTIGTLLARAFSKLARSLSLDRDDV